VQRLDGAGADEVADVADEQRRRAREDHREEHGHVEADEAQRRPLPPDPVGSPVGSPAVVCLVAVLGREWGANGAATAVLVSSVAFCIYWTFLFLRIRREPASATPTLEAALP